MKHNKKILIILLLFLFIVPINVHAKVSCSTITDTIEEYDAVVEELDELDCTDTSDSTVVATCNSDNTKKSYLLSKLFKYNDDAEDCNNKQLEKIIEDNEDKCSNVFGSTLKDIKTNMMTIFYILAPFLFIIFGSLDFFKIVTAEDPTKTIHKKNVPESSIYVQARTRFLKRLLALVLVYLIPAFLNILFEFNFSNYSLTGNVYSCKMDYTYYINKWETTYIPKVTNNTSNSSGSSGSNSSLGLGENNGHFSIRTEAPNSSNSYYDYSASNLYQCVWYAKYRAIEALSTSDLDASEISSKVDKISGSRGNGWVWYSLAVPGEQSATRDTESSGTLDSLVGFQYSDDYTKPRAGSIVSFQWTDSRCLQYHSGKQSTCYGHVAFVEDVDIEGNKIMVSDGWKNSSDGSFGFRSQWYDIDYMQSFGGNYVFEGYVYLMDPLK